MTDGEKSFMKLLMIWCAVLALLTHHNAREAHRHTHELACHVGAAALCEYHAGESHD